MNQAKGTLFILSGPSGVGKGTLKERLLEEFKDHTAFSVSATTRAPRPAEIDGQDYFFIKRPEFEEKIRRNKERDAADVAALEALGWHVIVVWECELTKQRFEDTMANLIAELRGYLEVQHIHSIPLSVRKLSNQDPSEL